MLKAIKDCVPGFNWQMSIIALVAIVGLVLCAGLPSWSLLSGVLPLLLLAACLLPCLIPLALWRKKRTTSVTLNNPSE